MDTNNWRNDESRQRIVNKINNILQRHVPQGSLDGMNKLVKIASLASRFEEKIFTIAINQQDYIRRISLKMLSLESKVTAPLGNHFLGSSFGNNQRPLNLAAEGDDQSQGEIEFVGEVGPPPQGVPVETIRRALRSLFISYLPRDAPDLLVPDALAEFGVPDAALAPALQVLETLRHQENQIAELEGELRGLRAVLSKSRRMSNQKITSEPEGGGSSVACEGKRSVL